MIPSTRLDLALSPKQLDAHPSSLYTTSTGRWVDNTYTPEGALVRVSKQITTLQKLLNGSGSLEIGNYAKSIVSDFKTRVQDLSIPDTLHRLIEIRRLEEVAMKHLGNLLFWVSWSKPSTECYLRTGGLPESGARATRGVGIAEALTLTDGSVNTARIPQLRATLKTQNIPYRTTVARGLLALEFKKELVERIEAVPVADLCPIGKQICRATCNVPPIEPLTQEHITTTLLSTLLSPIRQRKTASCFATRFAIAIQAWAPDKLLQDCIDLLKKGELTRLGFSFPCFTDPDVTNPLLYSWEYCLASMAEKGPGELFLPQILRAIRETLPIKEATLAVAWHHELQRQTRYLYDPNIAYATKANDGHSSQGGWVLYNPTRGWKRIDSPSLLSEHLLHVLKTACYRVASKLNESAFNSLIDKVIPRCKQQFYDPLQLALLVTSYNKHFLELHTPWVNRNGHNAYSVVSTYHEITIANEWPAHPIRSIGQLLHTLSSRLDELPHHVKERFRRDPHLPIGSTTRGKHAFNLLPGHPTFYPLWSGTTNMLQKIGALRRQAKILCEQPITAKERLYPIYALSLKLDQVPIEGSRKKFYKALQRVAKVKPEWVDAELIIEPSLIKEDLIIFADTNWVEGHDPVHLAIGPNPYTGDLALYQVIGDSLQIANQKEWIIDPDWLLPTNQHLNHGGRNENTNF